MSLPSRALVGAVAVLVATLPAGVLAQEAVLLSTDQAFKRGELTGAGAANVQILPGTPPRVDGCYAEVVLTGSRYSAGLVRRSSGMYDLCYRDLRTGAQGSLDIGLGSTGAVLVADTRRPRIFAVTLDRLRVFDARTGVVREVQTGLTGTLLNGVTYAAGVNQLIVLRSEQNVIEAVWLDADTGSIAATRALPQTTFNPAVGAAEDGAHLFIATATGLGTSELRRVDRGGGRIW